MAIKYIQLPILQRYLIPQFLKLTQTNNTTSEFRNVVYISEYLVFLLPSLDHHGAYPMYLNAEAITKTHCAMNYFIKVR